MTWVIPHRRRAALPRVPALPAERRRDRARRYRTQQALLAFQAWTGLTPTVSTTGRHGRGSRWPRRRSLRRSRPRPLRRGLSQQGRPRPPGSTRSDLWRSGLRHWQMAFLGSPAIPPGIGRPAATRGRPQAACWSGRSIGLATGCSSRPAARRTGCRSCRSGAATQVGWAGAARHSGQTSTSRSYRRIFVMGSPSTALRPQRSQAATAHCRRACRGSGRDRARRFSATHALTAERWTSVRDACP